MGTAGGDFTLEGLPGTPSTRTTPSPPRPTPRACWNSKGRGLQPRAGPAVLDLCGVFPLWVPDSPERIEDVVSSQGGAPKRRLTHLSHPSHPAPEPTVPSYVGNKVGGQEPVPGRGGGSSIVQCSLTQAGDLGRYPGSDAHLPTL